MSPRAWERGEGGAGQIFYAAKALLGFIEGDFFPDVSALAALYSSPTSPSRKVNKLAGDLVLVVLLRG